MNANGASSHSSTEPAQLARIEIERALKAFEESNDYGSVIVTVREGRVERIVVERTAFVLKK